MSGNPSSSSGAGSTAFSRLSRPGSGRLSGKSGGNSTPGSGGSLSPTSPMGPGGGGLGSSGSGLVPEHRIRPFPNLGPLPSPGGVVASSEQQEKRQGLKISFSQPNMRRAAALNLAPGALPSALAGAGATAGGGAPVAASQIPPSGGGGGGGALPRLSTTGMSSSSSSNRLSSMTSEAKSKLLMQKSAHSTGRLVLGPQHEFDFKAEDLEDEGEIGRGAFGTVNRMTFSRPGGFSKTMAVKRIRSTVDEREQKELLMDLDVVMRSNECPFIVLFFGAIFKEGDCWICMEMMDTSTDKFYKFIYEQLRENIPEKVIGKVTVATVRALNYLKEKLKIIHRDVKPSNILLDRGGNIKLCDFGISGQLIDSIAKTRDAGCRPYMAPERIDPQRAKGYDVRSDVWSLGITLIELATGSFPYPKWNSVFEQLQQVVHGDPPRLDPRGNGKLFTVEFVNFVNTCLIKEESQRPKYNRLLEHPFIQRSEPERVDVADYVTCVLERWWDDMDTE